MKYWLIGAAFAALSGCLVVVPIPVSTTVTPAAGAITPATTGFGKMLVDARAQNGVGPIEENAILTAAATRYAAELVATGRREHRGAGGDMPWDRAKAAGYCSGTVAENLAWGQTSEEQVLREWMESPGHRANILNGSLYRYGLARNGNVWVLMFGGYC